jgi:hypothetical protein
MGNLTNQLGYVTNTFFSGGEIVTPLTDTAFAWQNRGYGGLYVGTLGTLVAKTLNGNVITIVSASGFIPGLFGAVSSSSTAANIVGFDPLPVALPTSTTSTTSTTTAGPTFYPFQVGTGPGSGGLACFNAKAGTFTTVYADAASLAIGVRVFSDAGGTTPLIQGTSLTLGVGNPKWGIGAGPGPFPITGLININYGTCS